MIDAASIQAARERMVPLRLLADQAFSRAAGAPLIAGNAVRLLKDAAENYPAWLEAIQAARTTIHFETYILHADEAGREFAAALEAKAAQGVKVRLIYDWFGARGASSYFFWKRLRRAGVEVRCFNPPRLDDPAEWWRRDHRKTISIDGRIGFVSGLCVGNSWVGDPQRKIEPWRDTGVEIKGPAVRDLEEAFVRMWNSIEPESEPIAAPELPGGVLAGDIAMRVVASEPSSARVYRLDQLIAAVARKSIWLTDAYFIGTPAYVQSLRAAAFDGVDVRILLPRTSDVPMVRSVSRVGYRTLLDSGVRIFEWNGSMLHAKTSVVDGRWSRVGSTNLNAASWLANYEMDVVVEDESFAQRMEKMYLNDLEHSTEIVLRKGTKVRPRRRRKRRERGRGSVRSSSGRAATGVLAIGSTVGAAITSPELLGPAEAPIMAIIGLGLLGIIAIAILLPHVITVTVAILCAWASLVLLLRGIQLKFRSTSDGISRPKRRI